MANSPLTLRRINKLIGQALSLVQKATTECAKNALKATLRHLNKARTYHKKGNVHLREANLHLAMANLVWARF